ncbi:hypothetical protein [Mesorhizobium sp. KR9-304]|uniref:hypothetical protein n=1 Tax=Mesorhizobium sp. KR9-304 TaxID=3156614 RepID=UPI0032B3949B
MPVGVQSFTTPAGNVVPAQNGNKYNGPFVNKATFTHGSGETCSPLEYRQYVKGTFKVAGAAIAHSLCGSDFLSPTTFKEDGCGPGPTVDPCTAYGHRGCPTNPKDKYIPNQAAGCNFYMEDEPGFTNISSGTSYEIDLSFKGQIINTTTGAVVETRNWTVKGQTIAAFGPIEAMAMVGLRASDTVQGVYVGRSQTTGLPEVYVIISRGIGEPPLDAAAISVTLPNAQGVMPLAGPATVHEITMRGRSTATVVFPLAAEVALPAEARIKVPGGTLRFDVQPASVVDVE